MIVDDPKPMPYGFRSDLFNSDASYHVIPASVGEASFVDGEIDDTSNANNFDVNIFSGKSLMLNLIRVTF